MKFIEDVTEIAEIVLPQDDEEAETGTNKYDEIDRLSVSADEVAEYEDEIDGTAHGSWRFDLSLLVASVPDRSNCYALLELDWDDNWEAWSWSCVAVVEDAPSSQAAATAMLEQYAKERLPHSDGGGYERFLRGLMPPPETVQPNQLVLRLFQEASDLINGEESSGGDNSPSETELNDNEEVVWVSSTFDGSALINVFEVCSPSQTNQYIALAHSDGGVVVSCLGPWASLPDAEANFDTDRWKRIRQAPEDVISEADNQTDLNAEPLVPISDEPHGEPAPHLEEKSNHRPELRNTEVPQDLTFSESRLSWIQDMDKALRRSIYTVYTR